MPDTRLIERWLPIAQIGIESTRERTPMTPFPAPNRLHVWWARRPLVASRAAVLASLLPADADREKFLHVLGIHGDPVSRHGDQVGRGRKRSKEYLGLDNPYGYKRAFAYSPTGDDRHWLESAAGSKPWTTLTILDPTAGGGSIPIEVHSGLGYTAVANDLNPVAALDHQCNGRMAFGPIAVITACEQFDERGARVHSPKAEPKYRLSAVFPAER